MSNLEPETMNNNAHTLSQEQTGEHAPIKFTQFERELTLFRYVSASELQAVRRNYVKVTTQNHSAKIKKDNEKTETELGSKFIDFLGTCLQ
jgi:hypothetical protein